MSWFDAFDDQQNFPKICPSVVVRDECDISISVTTQSANSIVFRWNLWNQSKSSITNQQDKFVGNKNEPHLLGLLASSGESWAKQPAASEVFSRAARVTGCQGTQGIQGEALAMARWPITEIAYLNHQSVSTSVKYCKMMKQIEHWIENDEHGGYSGPQCRSFAFERSKSQDGFKWDWPSFEGQRLDSSEAFSKWGIPNKCLWAGGTSCPFNTLLPLCSCEWPLMFPRKWNNVRTAEGIRAPDVDLFPVVWRVEDTLAPHRLNACKDETQNGDRWHAHIVVKVKPGFAIALQLVLRLLPGGLLSLGPPCASFTWMNIATSKRSTASPYGDTSSAGTADPGPWVCPSPWWKVVYKMIGTPSLRLSRKT